MCYTLDCSFYLSALIPDEKNEKVSQFFLKKLRSKDNYVPSLFWKEIANVLFNAFKSKRLNNSDISDIKNLLDEHDLQTDSKYGIEYFNDLLDIMKKYELTSYDAVYLELARRKKGIMLTLDKNLRKACINAGVEIIEFE
jgi:predicted nucleic acid-binding protein